MSESQGDFLLSPGNLRASRLAPWEHPQAGRTEGQAVVFSRNEAGEDGFDDRLHYRLVGSRWDFRHLLLDRGHRKHSPSEAVGFDNPKLVIWGVDHHQSERRRGLDKPP